MAQYKVGDIVSVSIASSRAHSKEKGEVVKVIENEKAYQVKFPDGVRYVTERSIIQNSFANGVQRAQQAIANKAAEAGVRVENGWHMHTEEDIKKVAKQLDLPAPTKATIKAMLVEISNGASDSFLIDILKKNRG